VPAAAGRREAAKQKEESPDRRRNHLPGLAADTRSCRLGPQPGSVMSPVAPEARDCFQLGPGLPPKWPYRRMPDHSDPSNLGEGRAGFKPIFSMARPAAIADIGLTGDGHGMRQLIKEATKADSAPLLALLLDRYCYKSRVPTGGGRPRGRFTMRKHQPRARKGATLAKRCARPPLAALLLFEEHCR
jgi:hypothetical protein